MDLSGQQVKHIVDTLALGNSADVAELIYRCDLLTDEQLRSPLYLLSQLHNSTSDSEISVTEAGYQEPFWMLILNVPWFDHERTGPYTPLLLAFQDGIPKIAGKVLPWNEITWMFSAEEQNASSRLVTWWVIWLQKYQQTK